MEQNKNVFIMGDSYSTYSGYIPAGYHSYYGDDREAAPIVKGVEKTWWRILARDNKFDIVLNDSFSGSTVCNTVRENLSVESSFVNRIDKYISEGFFSENKIDTMFVFGGTNDSWINSPVGEVKYSDWTYEDLKCVLPAFCYLLDKAKNVVGEIVVVINNGLKPQITDGLVEVCKKNEIKYLILENVDKENGHPTETGMVQISNQISDCLNRGI